jgi:hypothetical protein
MSKQEKRLVMGSIFDNQDYIVETNRRIRDLKVFNKKLIYENEATRVIETNR